MSERRELIELQKAMQLGVQLTDAQLSKVAALRRAGNSAREFVRVGKVDLIEGEELMDFVWTMHSAVQTNRIILANGSLDAWLEGIFNDHVIVRDGNTGRLFRADFSRAADGSIEFSAPVEVRVTFSPVEEGDGVEKRAREEVVELRREPAGRWGFLPPAFRGRR